MERTKGRSLVLPLLSGKSDGHKPRKKLQKSVGKSRGQHQTKRVSIVVPNEPTTDTQLETGCKQSAEKPSLPLPPDLSDSKWSAYVRASGYASSVRPLPQSKQASTDPRPPVNIIPELSHLAIHDASVRSSPRSSNDTLLPHSPASSTSTMRRRHAKTPVFAIGQLEAGRLERPPNALAPKSSIEILAEQYRALLRSRSSVFADSHSEPPPSRHENRKPDETKRHSADAVSSQLQMHRMSADSPTGSPTSDDGTLVSFEEDAIYFKPISFTPEPQSPISPVSHFMSPLASPSPAPDNLSLQICMDLLTRDLSSTLASRPNHTTPDAAALQVWVMIEAYERLRDRLIEQRMGFEASQPLHQMFDMWLQSLYSIHDSLNEQARDAESIYDTLESEELD